ncbi:MAG: glycoside hydrolase family 28 protein [Bacteroidales bacterium]|nr:glycoside hydrolase family 28 protein [Bacteroidales bacterium]
MKTGNYNSTFRHFIIFALAAIMTCIRQYAQETVNLGDYIGNMPFDMPHIQLPFFEDKSYNIIDFGASGDGQLLNTGAFAAAIQTCHANGGGRVIVPPGIWLTGPIRFMSSVNLHLEKGALIVFSRDHKDYPVIRNPVNKSYIVSPPIYGFGLENIAITGEGILDGSGETWRPVKKMKTTETQWKKLVESGGAVSSDGKMYWPTREAMEGETYLEELMNKDKKLLEAKDYEPARDYMRPYMVVFYQCSNVLFDGPTFRNSPKFVLYPTYCNDMVIRNIKVFNEWWAQNGDGIDLGGGKNIFVHNCLVSVGDDAICMKSSKSKNYHEDPALQNVVITGCEVYHGHGGFVIGSNTDGGMRNILVNNCSFVTTDVGLRFKSSRGRGGLVENIFVRDIYMKDIVREAILFNTYYDASVEDTAVIFDANEKTPRFQKFYISNILCYGASQAIKILGLPEMPVQDILFENITISAEAGVECREARHINITNMAVIPEKTPVYSLYNSSDFFMKGITCPVNTEIFMRLEGKQTANIRLSDSDLSHAKKIFDQGKEVNRNAVRME